MNLFAVSFFGHREVDDPFVIEQQLEGNRQIMMRSDIKLPQPFASWSNSL